MEEFIIALAPMITFFSVGQLNIALSHFIADDLSYQLNCFAYVAIGGHCYATFINPIPHGGEGGWADSALLQIVFFITSVRDAAEPRNLVTFPKI